MDTPTANQIAEDARANIANRIASEDLRDWGSLSAYNQFIATLRRITITVIDDHTVTASTPDTPECRNWHHELRRALETDVPAHLFDQFKITRTAPTAYQLTF